MQANGSLSPEQFSTLQSVYTYLKAVTAHLDTRTIDADAEVSKTVHDLGLYCIDRMIAAFPSLAEWAAIGGGGGQ